jgi:hypothetical protein
MLGNPSATGTRVGSNDAGERVRYAFMRWLCEPSRSGASPSCLAQTVVSFESEEFPQDDWTLYACDIHRALRE